MDKLKIGFLGGCINRQQGIQRNDLYYSMFSYLLGKEKINNQILLEQYFSYDQLVECSRKFVDEKNPDWLFLFIRPFPLMPLHKPIIKYDLQGKKTGRTLHPALYNRELKWKGKLSEHQRTEPLQIIQRKKFELRDLNIIAGILIGLHSWAMKYLTKQIKEIHSFCNRKGKKIVVISPPKNPESIMGSLICKWTTAYFNKYCHNNQIRFVDINLISADYFEEDKIHFNVAGHKQLAELIAKEIFKG
ncbi:MAG: SGNH/GDSL hydrolase family protein [Bacteroidetes bacterium]|nr:SGNH/GDSL hydrolase family protein [Bacteroidota bacterium]